MGWDQGSLLKNILHYFTVYNGCFKGDIDKYRSVIYDLDDIDYRKICTFALLNTCNFFIFYIFNPIYKLKLLLICVFISSLGTFSY